jgi:hypothetical protein
MSIGDLYRVMQPHGIEITDGVCEAFGIDARVIHRTIEELHNF